MNTNKEYRQDVKDTFTDLSAAQGVENINNAGNNANMWEKTKEVAADIKDTIADTAKSAYETTKDFVSGTNLDTRNMDDVNNLQKADKEVNKDI